MCPLLPSDVSILCIDLPGHGHSSHYPAGMQYYVFWDGITLIRRIVRQYQWTRVTLMGHSLGGALAFMYASTYPEEVAKLINIDIAGPTVRSLEKLADAMGPMIDKWLSYESLPDAKIPSYQYDEMVQLVLSAYDGSVDEEGVKVLLKRGSTRTPPNRQGHPQPSTTNHRHSECHAMGQEEGEGGLYFTRDVRLKKSGLAQFTAEQVLAFAKRIRCKVLNIRADPGMKFDYPHVYGEVIEAMRQQAESVTFITVPGTHHVHLVTPTVISGHITRFLKET